METSTRRHKSARVRAEIRGTHLHERVVRERRRVSGDDELAAAQDLAAATVRSADIKLLYQRTLFSTGNDLGDCIEHAASPKCAAEYNAFFARRCRR